VKAVYAKANTSRAAGQMNRTEARRAGDLELRKRAGVVHDFAFEAVKLRLAGDTFLTCDFMLIMPDGMLEFEDVKGRGSDGRYIATPEARVKIKVAARTYPWFRFFTVWEDKAGHWNREEVTP
jgi:hypothetical protein